MEQEIISGLMARGVPAHIAQGMVANMIAESRLNPGINEAKPLVPGSRGGYGLNQWTGPRRVAFENYARERGVPLDDLNTQLDFTMYELQGPEKAAWQALQGAQTAEDAARLYSERFLRPGIPHMDRRLAEARRLSGVPLNFGPNTSRVDPVAASGFPGVPPTGLPAQQAAAPQDPRQKLAEGLLAAFNDNLAPQQAQSAPMPLLPIGPAYQAQKRDNLAPLLSFFQSLG